MNRNPHFLRIVVCSILFALTLPATTFAWPWSETQEQSWSKGLNANKQAIFNAFHPVGTARSIVVHNVQQKGSLLAVRFTLYWQGPVEKDGYTKIQGVFDLESNRWISSQILATNGITNAEVKEGAIDFGVGFLQGYLESQQ